MDRHRIGVHALLDHMVASRGAVEAFQRTDALFPAHILAQSPSVVVSLDNSHELACRDRELIRERRDVNDAHSSGLHYGRGRAGGRASGRPEPNRIG